MSQADLLIIHFNEKKLEFSILLLYLYEEMIR